MSPTRVAILAGLVALAALRASAWAAGDHSPQALIEAGHWNRARAAIEPLLEANPNDPEALLMMSRVKEVAGDLDTALILVQKALAVSPKSADCHCQLAIVYGREAIRASIFRRPGLAGNLRKAAETALKIDPGHVEARRVLIEFYLLAPGIIGGDKTRARTLAEELVKIEPAIGDIALARVAHEERQPARQEELLLKSCRASPPSYESLITLAEFYSYGPQRKVDLVERYALEAVKLDPGRITAYRLAAQAYAREERWPELDEILERSGTNVPDDLSPFFSAGRVISQMGKDPARAERYFREYLTREPELGAPSHAQAYWRLGLTLEKLSRKDEAVEAVRTAVKLDSGLEGAKKDLKRLR